MDDVNISSLLLAEEEKIRSELRADAVIDQNRKQSADRLDELFSRLLLKYNAAYTDDRTRQAMADSLTATAQDMLGLLLAASARKEIEKRRVHAGAVIGLLLAVICALVSVLSVRQIIPVSIAFLTGTAVCAFAAGRLWYGEREVRVLTELDPDVIWKTLKKTAETMDRKSEEFIDLEKTLAQESEAAAADPAAAPLSPEELKLCGDLLEALYSENGDFALRQLKKIVPFLESRGITVRDCDAESTELFELLPTRKQACTQRPALLCGDRLLLAGRATEHVDA